MQTALRLSDVNDATAIAMTGNAAIGVLYRTAQA